MASDDKIAGEIDAPVVDDICRIVLHYNGLQNAVSAKISDRTHRSVHRYKSQTILLPIENCCLLKTVATCCRLATKIMSESCYWEQFLISS